MDVDAWDKVVAAWESQTSHAFSRDGLEAACWAFHEHMIAEEADAVIANPWVSVTTFRRVP